MIEILLQCLLFNLLIYKILKVKRAIVCCCKYNSFRLDIPINHNLGTDVTVTTPNYNLYVRIHEVGTTTAKEGEEGSFMTPVKLEVKTIKEGRIREKILVTNGEDKVMEVCNHYHIRMICFLKWLIT